MKHKKPQRGKTEIKSDMFNTGLFDLDQTD